MSQLQYYFRSLPSGVIDTITGNSGGPVTGDGVGNINVVGAGNINVAGNAGTFTETITITGIIPIANGGTNAGSFATTDGTIYFDGTRLVTTAIGNPGQVLTSNGVGVAPTYQNAVGNLSTLTGDSGGAVGPTAFNINTVGGHNITVAGTPGTSTVTFNVSGTTNHAVQVGNATASLTSLAVGATGQGLMGNTGADPSWTGSPSFSGTVTAGTGFVATTGNVTITAGNLALPNTNGAGTQGIITFGGSNFITNSGTNSVFVGANSGTLGNTGSGNVGVGTNVLNALTSGDGNIAIGQDSLNSCTTGGLNIFIGYAGLGDSLTIGNNNIGLGNQSLAQIVSGSHNTAIGDASGIALTGTDSNNILVSNVGVVGDNNTIRLGTYGTGTDQQNKCYIAAAYSNFGTQNTFVGEQAGNVTLTTGSATNNVGVGYTALDSLTTGNANTGCGWSALSSVTTGAQNAVIGYGCGDALTTGGSNAGLGYNVLSALVTGSNNIALGTSAGTSYTTSESSNIVIGNTGTAAESHVIRLGTYGGGSAQQNKCYIASAYSNFGTENTFVGELSGNITLTTGSATNNVGLGYNTLSGLTTGAYNLAFGTNVGAPYTTESNNILIGNSGTVADANTIRIGTQGSGAGQQNIAFMAGIAGVTVSNTNLVTINTSTGQLGSQPLPSGATVWNVITAASATMSSNNGYIANNAGTCVLTLPATPAVGDIIEVTGINNATGWRIAQNAGQLIHFGSSTTTTGIGGSLTSTATNDSIRLVCVVANTTFNVLSSIGNITVV